MHQRHPMPRARWLPTCLLVLVLAACTAGQRTAAVERADDVAAFEQIVTELAAPEMQGRGAGYEGLDRARDLIAERFAEMGLAPAFRADGEGRSYTQPFDIPLGVHAAEQRLVLQRPGQNERRVFEPGHAFNALGFSGEGAFRGEPLFVGYGIVAPEHDYNSYADLPEGGLQGKVAIAFRYEPMDDDQRSLWAGDDGRPGRWTEAASLTNKAEWAAERGAVALLVVDPPAMDAGGPLRATAATAFAEPAPIPVMHLRTSAFRDILQAANRSAGEALRTWQQRANAGADRPDALTGPTLAGEVRLERPRATIHNVAGLVPGHGALADELVVVGAHYDHLGFGEIGSLAPRRGEPALHPGADDNASGTAGLILLAEHMKAYAEEHPDTDRRTVLFVAFSGEERGLLGSVYLVNHPDELAVDLDAATAMINFDMIGRLRSTLWAFGADTGTAWRDLLEQAREDLDVRFTLRSTGSGVGMSDHTSFYVRRVPVLHLFTGVHGDYHRPTDTADKINAEGGAVVVALAADILEQLVTMPEPMTFTPDEGEDPHAGVDLPDGHGARLGVMPDYATLEGDQGAGITAVMPGTAAAEAGLQEGDRITHWDGEPLPNVRALTRRLAESQPGDEVELTVQRGDETLQLPVELGGR